MRAHDVDTEGLQMAMTAVSISCLSAAGAILMNK